MNEVHEVCSATVFIVDEDAGDRQRIASLVRSIDLAPRCFRSARAFLATRRRDEAGCIVLDALLPDMCGLQLQRELLDRDDPLPMLFVATTRELHVVTAAMRAGAVDFIAKPADPEKLTQRVDEAVKLDTRRRSELALKQSVETLMSTLSSRERDVARLLSQGFATKNIAKRLGVCQKTVDNYRAIVLDKMGVENVAQLALLMTSVSDTPLETQHERMR